MATRAQIIPNAYTQIRCETFNCAENAVWSLGAPDGPLGTQYRLCDADARSLIETLPDGLLPAVLVLIRRHVEAGTDFAKELATLLGGPALVPAPKAEPVMDQNAIGEYVLAQVAQETPWGMDLLAKITAALPDDGAPDAPVPPIGPDWEPGAPVEHRCICGKTYEGEDAPRRLAAHQRQCRVFKEQKGEG